MKNTLLISLYSLIVSLFAAGCCCGGSGYEEWDAEREDYDGGG